MKKYWCLIDGIEKHLYSTLPVVEMLRKRAIVGIGERVVRPYYMTYYELEMTVEPNAVNKSEFLKYPRDGRA